jgi:hypothetical protein
VIFQSEAIMNRHWSRLLLALILAVGFATVWGFVAGWLTTTIADAARGSSFYESLQFKPDGTPVVAYWNVSGLRQYRDLAGRTLDISDNQPWLTGTWLFAPSAHSGPGVRQWNERIRSFNDCQRSPVYWYFIAGAPGDSTGYFEGYDSISAARVGYLGATGFQDTKPAPGDRFTFTNTQDGDVVRRVQSTQRYYGAGAVEPRVLSVVGPTFPTADLPDFHVYVLDDSGRAWLIDLRNRNVLVAFDRSPLVAVGLMWFFHHDRDIGQMRVALRSQGAVITMNGKNEVLRTVPMPEPLRGLDFNWAETTAGDVVVHYPLPRDPWDDVSKNRVLHLDLTGHVKSDEEITLAARGQGGPVVRTCAASWMPGVLPLAVAVAGFLPSQVQTAWPNGYWAALTVVVGRYLPAIFIVVGIGVIAAVAAHRRELRYGSIGTDRWLWPAFTFLLGLPGWVGYRYSRTWPALEPCPACGKTIPRDRFRCHSCQSELPTPPLVGTEVFA